MGLPIKFIPVVGTLTIALFYFNMGLLVQKLKSIVCYYVFFQQNFCIYFSKYAKFLKWILF